MYKVFISYLPIPPSDSKVSYGSSWGGGVSWLTMSLLFSLIWHKWWRILYFRGHGASFVANVSRAEKFFLILIT